MASSTGLPSTHGEEPSKLWSSIPTFSHSSECNSTSSLTSMSFQWNKEFEQYQEKTYGAQLLNIGSYHSDAHDNPGKFDLALLSNDSSRRMLITKSDAELQDLASFGARITYEKLSEATFAMWLGGLLPPTFAKTSLICNHSMPVQPGAMPAVLGGVDASSLRYPPEFPWTTMRPDSVWFYNRLSFSEGVDKAYRRAINNKRAHATIALNAENKCTLERCDEGQRQAFATAMVALCERIAIHKLAHKASASSSASTIKTTTTTSQLCQYFFIFCPSEIQLWRVRKPRDDEYRAWRLQVDKMDCCSVSGLKRFIEVWNRLISHLVGPVLSSLTADLELIAQDMKKAAAGGCVAAKSTAVKSRAATSKSKGKRLAAAEGGEEGKMGLRRSKRRRTRVQRGAG